MARKDFKELERRIGNCGIVTIPMGELRDRFGYQRLGANVRTMIEDTLHYANIDFIPYELPNRETAMIRLFPADSSVKALIHAALTLDPEHDEILARAASALDGQMILDGANGNGDGAAPKRGRGRPKQPKVLTPN